MNKPEYVLDDFAASLNTMTPWEAHNSLLAVFASTYTDDGYSQLKPVDITSGIDSTVTFIGSHISVFKPYFTNGNAINTNGICMVQPCLRAQNCGLLENDDIVPRWASYFVSMGAMRPYESLTDMTRQATTLLLKNCVEDPAQLRLRVSEHDKDLYETAQIIASENSLGLEVDTQPPPYYRHKIGLEEVHGRNLNLAVWHAGRNQYEDVGNVIIIEPKPSVNTAATALPYGVELAMGASTLLSKVRGEEAIHAFEVFRSSPELEYHPLSPKLGDCVLSALALAAEGVKPGASNNTRRALRDYLRGITHNQHATGAGKAAVAAMIEEVGTRIFGGAGIDTVAAVI